jgi:hypothetical protein
MDTKMAAKEREEKADADVHDRQDAERREQHERERQREVGGDMEPERERAPAASEGGVGVRLRAGTSTPFYTENNITANQANYDGMYSYNNNAKGCIVRRHGKWDSESVGIV